MTCPAIGTEHECPKIGTESECLINGQLCSSIKQVPLKEVDIYLLGEIPGRSQRIQVHTYAVGDEYKMLPEDDEPDITNWTVNDIRGRIRESKEA